MIIILIIISALWSINCAYGQIQEGGIPESSHLSNQTTRSLPTLSFSLDQREIKANTTDAYDVGVAEQVNIDFVRQSSKYTSSNGVQTYQLLIEVGNALGLGVEFGNFYLPSGTQLFAYNEDKSILLGAFTSKNNQANGRFAIQPISGTKLILEYNQPSGVNEQPQLVINRIAKIYRPLFGNTQTAQQKSSDCYKNVHCVSGLEVERSVMKWLYYDEKEEAYYVCSCALINQDVAANDLKPYVVTANHCGKDADLTTAVFYFNYQNSTCSSNNASQYNYTMTGGNERAKRAIFDMFFLELYSFPPPDYNVHLSGWDRSDRGDLPDDVMGIHHPEGIDKKISLGTFQANTNPNFWRVEWDRNNAPTAGGSSGSPLFEEDRDRIIGWLSYGSSSCEKLDGIDRYGKFRDAWSSIYGADQRLRDWLDPNGNDNNELDGRDPCFTNLVIENRTFYSAQLRYQPENKVTVQAARTMQTLGKVVIKTSSEHKFTARNQIVLEPGFHSEFGSNFTATLEPCDVIAKNIVSVEKPSRATNTPHQLDTEEHDLLVESSIHAFPNPSRDFTTLEYTLSKEDFITLEVYNINGVLVKTLMVDQQHKKGIYQADFDMSELPSGHYNCVLRTSSILKNCRIVKL